MIKLAEAIKLPIEIGDTILTGKFRNHRQVVDTIETDDWGHPTVNGKSILKVRIAKLMNKNIEERLSRVIEQASVLTEAEVDADLTTSSGSPAIQMSVDTARDNDLFPKAAGKEITIKGGKRVKLLKAISMNGALWAVKVLSESADSRIKIGVSVKFKDSRLGGGTWRVTGIEDDGEVLLRDWDGHRAYAKIDDLTFVSTFAK